MYTGWYPVNPPCVFSGISPNLQIKPKGVAHSYYHHLDNLTETNKKKQHGSIMSW